MPWPVFEPGRLAALPPQDSVSTSSTSRAGDGKRNLPGPGNRVKRRRPVRATFSRVSTEPLCAMDVLVIEDDSDAREGLVRTLSRAGCDVTAVDDGLAALAQVRERTFDAIVL